MLEGKIKEDCCGCRACEQICPTSCIEMISDECGFLYPIIDKDKCLNCKKCQIVCPSINSKSNEDANRKVFAMSHNNKAVVEGSSSGGAFYGICKWGIDNGYVIYGVAFDSKFNAVYGEAESFDDCSKFYRSKYVQSNSYHVFKRIAKDLNEGKNVIFSGTPCYIKALSNYLGKDYDNLLLIDLICHGIPSPLVWNGYLMFLRKHYNGDILQVNMRDKRYGWNHRSLTSIDISSKGNVCDTPATNTFMAGYGMNIFFRPSCYECRFANFDRPGDLTIADFWGINEVTTKFKDEKGVSCCISNTEKGLSLLQNILKGYIYEERVLADCQQPNLYHPATKSPLTDRFWNDWVSSGNNYEYIANKYLGFSMRSKFFFYMKKYLKRMLK